MNAVFSLKTTKFDNNCSGYTSYDDFLACLELAVRSIKPTSDNVVFYADKQSVQKIKPIKHLFDEVVVNLDEINWVQDYNWAFNKLFIYKQQTQPFVHIDNDVFLHQGLPKQFIDTCDFYFQGRELLSIHKYYGETLNLTKECIDKQMLPYMPDYAINTGVAGFNDLSIIEKYYDNAERFVKNNQRIGYKEPMIKYHLCILFEQLFITPLVESKRVNYILTDNFQETGIPYTHLISSSKREKSNIDLVKQRLSQLK